MDGYAMNRGKRLRIGGIISWLLGLLCALVLGAVFYGAMVYQLTGEETRAAQQTAPQHTPAPLAQGLGGDMLYPGPLLAISGAQLAGETAEDVRFGGRMCRVIRRTYALPSGERSTAVSAYPAAYLERMAQESYVPQLITGFSLAGMDAVYALRGQDALLCARSGEYVYMIETAADEQSAYALGAAAYLE